MHTRSALVIILATLLSFSSTSFSATKLTATKPSTSVGAPAKSSDNANADGDADDSIGGADEPDDIPTDDEPADICAVCDVLKAAEAPILAKRSNALFEAAEIMNMVPFSAVATKRDQQISAFLQLTLKALADGESAEVDAAFHDNYDNNKEEYRK